MGDGHLNKCKDCTRKDTAENTARKMQDPEWVENEAERHRKKAKRQYHEWINEPWFQEKIRKDKKRYAKKYPEKTKAKQLSQRVSCPKGLHKHHWSYQVENAKDIICIDPKSHSYIHRFLNYVPALMCYETKDGILLDTKEKHLDYISSLLGRELKQAA